MIVKAGEKETDSSPGVLYQRKYIQGQGKNPLFRGLELNTYSGYESLCGYHLALRTQTAKELKIIKEHKNTLSLWEEKDRILNNL